MSDLLDEVVGLAPQEYAFRTLRCGSASPAEWNFHVIDRAGGIILEITLRVDDLQRLIASTRVAASDFDYELSRRERLLDKAGA
jgi:hypothetical protein